MQHASRVRSVLILHSAGVVDSIYFSSFMLHSKPLSCTGGYVSRSDAFGESRQANLTLYWSMCDGWHSWLRLCGTRWEVPASIPGREF